MIGHGHYVFFASACGNGVKLLDPEGSRLAGLTTRSIGGMFRLIGFYRKLLRDMGFCDYWKGCVEFLLYEVEIKGS